MLPDRIREWLADHPKVLNFVFVAGFYFAALVDLASDGAGEVYSGP